MDTTDLKEKLALVGVTAAVFLPLRLIAGQYLTEHWLGNFGIAAMISVALVVLVKKDKLGAFGAIFKNQITKALWGRSAKVIIVTLIVFMCYFGTTVLLADRGNTVYHDDKELLFQSISGKNLEAKPFLKLNGPQIQNAQMFGLVQMQYLEYLFSISYALLNDATHGWLVNLHLILFVEQLEILGLFWFYRKLFRPNQLIRA
jgi:hypothetical protein